MKLEKENLVEIKGGAVGLKTAILIGVGGLLVLIAGILDGYLNPIKCN